jgi:hypothetical protein
MMTTRTRTVVVVKSDVGERVDRAADDDDAPNLACHYISFFAVTRIEVVWVKKGMTCSLLSCGVLPDASVAAAAVVAAAAAAVAAAVFVVSGCGHDFVHFDCSRELTMCRMWFLYHVGGCQWRMPKEPVDLTVLRRPEKLTWLTWDGKWASIVFAARPVGE